MKWLEDKIVAYMEGIREKLTEREPENVPSHLLPCSKKHVKDVKVKRKIKSAINGKTVMYEGDNGFTYVDPDALPTADEINALNYPHG